MTTSCRLVTTQRGRLPEVGGSQMATMQDMESFLDAAGAQLISTKNHLKWKLPTGRLFILQKTPSDHRSCNNAMSFLRRELRQWSPELANGFGRGSLPHRSRPSNTIGEQINLKALSAHPAIPGSIPTEIEFEILEPTPEPETLYHKRPRLQRDPRPKPSQAKTLSPEQLTEANRLLREQGQAAMDAYISQSHDAMISVSSAIVAERFSEPLPQPPIEEEPEMSAILERATRELEATTSRIAAKTEEITALTASRDVEILRQTQLEEYIKRHTALAKEAADLLAEILPPMPQPSPTAQPRLVKHRTMKSGKEPLPFTIRDIREKVFPILRTRSAEFKREDVVKATQDAGLQIESSEGNRLMVWLWAELQRPAAEIKKGTAPGAFCFKDAEQPAAVAEEELQIASA